MCLVSAWADVLVTFYKYLASCAHMQLHTIQGDNEGNYVLGTQSFFDVPVVAMRGSTPRFLFIHLQMFRDLCTWKCRPKTSVVPVSCWPFCPKSKQTSQVSSAILHACTHCVQCWHAQLQFFSAARQFALTIVSLQIKSHESLSVSSLEDMNPSRTCVKKKMACASFRTLTDVYRGISQQYLCPRPHMYCLCAANQSTLISCSISRLRRLHVEISEKNLAGTRLMQSHPA